MRSIHITSFQPCITPKNRHRNCHLQTSTWNLVGRHLAKLSQLPPISFLTPYEYFHTKQSIYLKTVIQMEEVTYSWWLLSLAHRENGSRTALSLISLRTSESRVVILDCLLWVFVLGFSKDTEHTVYVYPMYILYMYILYKTNSIQIKIHVDI